MTEEINKISIPAETKINKFKKLFKNKKILIPAILAVLILVYGAYAGCINKNKAVNYETSKVEKGDLNQTVEATGNIESSNDLSLHFETGGTIEKVFVKEGDKVKSGVLLASLRAAELNAAVAQASANLNQKLAGSTPEYLAQLQASLDKANADLSAVQGVVPGVENSKLVQNAYDNTIGVLQNVQITLSTSLYRADEILGIDNTLLNDEYENILSTVSLNKLTEAKNNYSFTKMKKIDFDAKANSLTPSSSHEEINQAVESGKTALLSMKDLLYLVNEVLNNTFPGNSLSISELDGLKTNIQTARADVTSKYSSLISQSQTIETARNNYYGYEALAAKAAAALKDAQNPPRDVDVAYYRAVLAQAVANHNKAILRAPIDGVVTKINKKAGEFISISDAVIEMLTPHYEVKVDIPETDVVKINLGDSVVITLDAFGDEVKFTGKIANIDPASTEIQDVVYYKVRVALDDTDKQIKPGMTANVIVKTASREGVLMIPSRAVRTGGNGKYVRVLQDKKEIEKPIALGIRGNDGKVEVLDGLVEGEEVIISVKN